MDDLKLDEITSMVLDCADLIPQGKVATYGDIATMVGTGPRQVGRIMAIHGHLTCWWRVVRSNGGSQVAARASVKWDEEEISYSRGVELKVRMSEHRITAEVAGTIVEKLSALEEEAAIFPEDPSNALSTPGKGKNHG